MEQSEKKYQKAFNVGYQLGKHEPELLEKLIRSKHGSKEYSEVLKLGQKQFEKDRVRDEMAQARERNKEQDKERER